MTAATSIDPGEVARFEALAASWWDPEGPMRPLHQLNPLRLAYIRAQFCRHFARDAELLRPLAGLSVLDVGCGAGLLTEPLARMGADCTGIDAGEALVAAARHHAGIQHLPVHYRCALAEDLAGEDARFDAVVCMEVIEHVADLPGFLAALAALTRPGGALALSTLNRTARSFATAIVGAEYLLRWLPAGTHDWRRFVRPAELNRLLRAHGAVLADVSGLSFRPLSRDWRLSRDTSVNYLAFAQRDG